MRSLMRSSGHFRGTEGAGSFSVVAPDPDVAGATPVFLVLGRLHVRAHDHAHAVN